QPSISKRETSHRATRSIPTPSTNRDLQIWCSGLCMLSTHFRSIFSNFFWVESNLSFAGFPSSC
ncbi:unnamed protein product, partial [Linum tenue]